MQAIGVLVLPGHGGRAGGAVGRHSWWAGRPCVSAPSTAVTETTESDGDCPREVQPPSPRQARGRQLGTVRWVGETLTLMPGRQPRPRAGAPACARAFLPGADGRQWGAGEARGFGGGDAEQAQKGFGKLVY